MLGCNSSSTPGRTVRYAPISWHIQRELCQKDDIETWVYMCVELTNGNFPWKNIADANQVRLFVAILESFSSFQIGKKLTNHFSFLI